MDIAEMTRRGILLLLCGLSKFCGLVTRLLFSNAVASWTFVRPAGIRSAELAGRRVGVAYSMWHYDNLWPINKDEDAWGEPTIGYYASNDEKVIATHAEIIMSANIDYIIIDWSNNIDTDVRTQRGSSEKVFIEGATLVLFEVYKKLHTKPKITFMIGMSAGINLHNTEKLTRKADQISEMFLQPNDFAQLFEYYFGKPLLVVFLGPPLSSAQLPEWGHPAFTVRFMTGFVTDQPLASAQGVSEYGWWSWEDRGRPSFSVCEGVVEHMCVVPSWYKSRTAAGVGRRNGLTFLRAWKYAREAGPRFVMVGTFNEWWLKAQESAEHSKDIEPSRSFGTLYLDIVRTQAALFKKGL